MIKLTMTNGLVYILPPSEALRPAVDNDEAAWEYWPKARQAVRNVLNNIHKHTSFYIVFTEDLIKALSDIPEIASVEDITPNLSDDDDDDDEKPVFNPDGSLRVIY